MTTAFEAAAVEIRLHSSDRELQKVLSDVLAAIREPKCALALMKLEEPEPNADLWLWDYEPGKPLPLKAGFRVSKHLFLVNKQDLAEFRAIIAPVEANILLKPISSDTLKATLGLAVAAHWDRVSSATSLREERDDLLQCLIETSLHVQDHDHERTSFLARAAHDFQAPATAVNGYCGLLLGEHLGALNEMQKEVVHRMQHSARRLSRMTAAMFALSVGRHVKRSPNLVQNDIRDCLEQALREVMAFADEKRIAITTDLAPCEFPLYFDTGQMEQVLINILDNACKFTPKAGVIAVVGYADSREPLSAGTAVSPAMQRARVDPGDPDCYRIDIQDSGAPIPFEHLHQIFEDISSDGTGDRSGGGLGLAITRMIMAQHDGRVWAENTTNGPRFSLVLPRRQKVINSLN